MIIQLRNNIDPFIYDRPAITSLIFLHNMLHIQKSSFVTVSLNGVDAGVRDKLAPQLILRIHFKCNNAAL